VSRTRHSWTQPAPNLTDPVGDPTLCGWLTLAFFSFSPGHVKDDVGETSTISSREKAAERSTQLIRGRLVGFTIEAGDSRATHAAAIRRDPHHREHACHPGASRRTLLHASTLRASQRWSRSRRDGTCSWRGCRFCDGGLPSEYRLFWWSEVPQGVRRLRLDRPRPFARLVHSRHLEFSRRVRTTAASRR